MNQDAKKKPQRRPYPAPRLMRHKDAVDQLRGPQPVADAIKAGLLKPVCKPTRKQTYYRTVDVLAIEEDILEGRYPGGVKQGGEVTVESNGKGGRR